ncbi:MAG: UDP-N-acetylmuramoyl-L-alanyl-D-glutamate--2,6-diaminopimelate ligase [Actinomycetota bacterium]
MPVRPLRELLAPLPHARVAGEADTPVAGLSYRSKELRPGWLFFAVPGEHEDGHDHAAEAVANGASVVVSERPLQTGVTEVVVPSVREAMGPVAGSFYGRPSDEMVVIGVTGTNGKTTITYLLEQVFQADGSVPGMIGTTGIRIGGRVVGHDRTTPEAPDLHRQLAEMRDLGVRGVAMEVSSHGLDQHRVGGIRFSCAVFTNLSQDHLDYHGTIEEYFRAKASLFTGEMSERAAINHDSPEGRTLVGRIPTLTFGSSEGAELRAEDVKLTPRGISFKADGLEVRSKLRGEFNVSNCLAALAASRQVGIPDEHAVRGIAELAGVPGRMEPVEAGQAFEVLVDYAHTPDSLENVLGAARPLAAAHRVIAVIGCGGDRDRGKRPLMGEAATRLADLTVLTSDNPRSEDPAAILREIERGARSAGGRYTVEVDRRAAIRLALGEAEAGDVVVIAGKGHETGQEFADRTIPFDDRVVAREEIEALLGADR